MSNQRNDRAKGNAEIVILLNIVFEKFCYVENEFILHSDVMFKICVQIMLYTCILSCAKFISLTNPFYILLKHKHDGNIIISAI